MLDLKSRLSRSYLHSSPNPSFDKGGVCCKPLVCHLRCGDAGYSVYSVYSVYSGLVIYAARFKWQGLIADHCKIPVGNPNNYAKIILLLLAK